MNKAYIVHYVGYDRNEGGMNSDFGFTYELPEEIHNTIESAKKEFERMVAEELENWDLSEAEIEQSEDLFYISSEQPESWTEIKLKCVTIKQ